MGQDGKDQPCVCRWERRIPPSVHGQSSSAAMQSNWYISRIPCVLSGLTVTRLLALNARDSWIQADANRYEQTLRLP
jgi:hypothetical protein